MPQLTPQDALQLAVRLHQADRLVEAEGLFLQILQSQPRWGDAHAQFANLLLDQGKLDFAAAALQSAIANNTTYPAQCHSNLGVLLYRQGRYDQSATACRQAIALQPDSPIFHRNLADALLKLDQYSSAEQTYRQALDLDPQSPDLHVGIGLSLYHRSRYAEALGEFESAMALDPAHVNAAMNAVLCHGRLGNREETESMLRKTIALSPNEPELTSGLVMILNYSHGDDPAFMLRESMAFDHRHTQSIQPLPARSARSSTQNRPLRIGYISPDFRHHPVAFFLQPVFQHHNRQKYFIACYSAVEKRDATTAFFELHSSLWRNIVGQTDQQVARQIDDDQIDILIDLAGHTDSNRLPVLAYRPAPIQITWLGYPNTTGMNRVDYRITDANADPLNSADPFYTEKLIRLPDSFFVYQPPSNAPEVLPAPVLANGHVTFGSFNNIAKLTPKMGELWGQILQAVPNSRLLIAGAVYSAGDRLRAMITGVDPQRIMIAESTNFESYLRLFEQVDIALDSYPWAGHTTTCHALWMGVPVVSLAGPTAISRAGVSVMAPLGLLDDWVAFTEADYIQLATRWSQRPAELNELRLGMRDRMRASPILNAERFTRQLEYQLALSSILTTA